MRTAKKNLRNVNYCRSHMQRPDGAFSLVQLHCQCIAKYTYAYASCERICGINIGHAIHDHQSRALPATLGTERCLGISRGRTAIANTPVFLYLLTAYFFRIVR